MVLEDTSKIDSDNVSSNSKMSKFELTVAAATATAQKTAAALMAAHAPTSAYQNIPNFNCVKDIGNNLKPPIIFDGRSTFVIPKNKLFGALVPVNQNFPTKTSSNPLNKEIEVENKPKRKSKWGPNPQDDAIVKRGLALALQTRAEQIAAQLDSGFLDIEATDIPRSPSPPPIYDSNGQRTNTREGRRREQLEIERREAIGECMKLNPAYKPPAGYKPVYKEAKLFIPVKYYPGYNFIGLILGPRGNTQKRMEQETGTKIAIRGRGALKEGKRPVQSGRRDKDLEGLHDDLHVHITGDCIEKVDAAVALIEPLLTPVDEVENMHKRKQLRELAEMNGTIRDFLKICSICGELGHQNWQCSKEALITFQSKVVCSICGNGGHPSMDCPQKTSKSTSAEDQTLDVEYMNFLKELNNGSLGVVSNATSSSIATSTSAPELPSTNATWNGVHASSKQSITSNNTLLPQPRIPIPTIMNRPQIIYIRSPPPWRGINGYNGLQPLGVPTKLIRIASGNCIQQQNLCISSTTNGQTAINPESDSKSNSTTDNTTQKLESTITYVQSPISTIGTNQSGPRLQQNPIRMVTSSNPIGMHPQQMIRPMYPTNMHPSISSQHVPSQQIRIIHRPPNGMVNPINVVRSQLMLPNQTTLQRPTPTQPLQGLFRPNSLQTQSQICAWPQPIDPTCPSQGQQSSQLSLTPSSSHIPSQSWQTLPMNATNCIQPQHINQCIQPPPPLPQTTTFQSNTNVIDLQPKHSIGLVSQVPSLLNPLNTQNYVSINKSTSNEVINSQEAQLQTLVKPQSSFGNTQSIDVEYEKLMASVGIT